MMQRIEWNGGLCHGEQKANSHKSGKNGLKMFVVVVVVHIGKSQHKQILSRVEELTNTNANVMPSPAKYLECSSKNSTPASKQP